MDPKAIYNLDFSPELVEELNQHEAEINEGELVATVQTDQKMCSHFMLQQRYIRWKYLSCTNTSL